MLKASVCILRTVETFMNKMLVYTDVTFWGKNSWSKTDNANAQSAACEASC